MHVVINAEKASWSKKGRALEYTQWTIFIIISQDVIPEKIYDMIKLPQYAVSLI